MLLLPTNLSFQPRAWPLLLVNKHVFAVGAVQATGESLECSLLPQNQRGTNSDAASKALPHVIETSIGIDRYSVTTGSTGFSFICEDYHLSLTILLNVRSCVGLADCFSQRFIRL